MKTALVPFAAAAVAGVLQLLTARRPGWRVSWRPTVQASES